MTSGRLGTNNGGPSHSVAAVTECPTTSRSPSSEVRTPSTANMEAPLLVTGSHRSGTTWVGRMLALSPALSYVREPFNIDHPGELNPEPFDCWYRYLPPEKEKPDRFRSLRYAAELRYPLWYRLKRENSWRGRLRHLRTALGYALDRWRGKRPLLKDPLALLSAEWLAAQFGVDVLVMIRHPAAFAGSLKKKGWTFSFDNLLQQPRLLIDHFSAYQEEIEEYANGDYDIVDQAAFLWKLLYTVVAEYEESHPEWTYLRHEDTARHPVRTFQSLYDRYGLEFTENIETKVKEYSNPSPDQQSTESIQRDSQAVIKNWTERLTESEIARVRRRTEPIAAKFYTSDDWAHD